MLEFKKQVWTISKDMFGWDDKKYKNVGNHRERKEFSFHSCVFGREDMEIKNDFFFFFSKCYPMLGDVDSNFEILWSKIKMTPILKV